MPRRGHQLSLVRAGLLNRTGILGFTCMSQIPQFPVGKMRRAVPGALLIENCGLYNSLSTYSRVQQVHGTVLWRQLSQSWCQRTPLIF